MSPHSTTPAASSGFHGKAEERPTWRSNAWIMPGCASSVNKFQSNAGSFFNQNLSTSINILTGLEGEEITLLYGTEYHYSGLQVVANTSQTTIYEMLAAFLTALAPRHALNKS